ncbi:MAG: UMP kinase [Endomicrobiia bacterium]
MKKYKRVILKLSGEILAGGKKFGFDQNVLERISQEIKMAKSTGTEIGIVIGGGNFWRGSEEKIKGLNRVTSDYMGMLATILNACVLQSSFEKYGMKTVIQSAIPVEKICEPYIPHLADRELKNGKILIFAGGTGNPYFTTDTTAALRAVELNANCMLKATKVDGVYTDDPIRNPKAKKFTTLKFIDAIKRNLKIMDITAFSLCMENKIEVVVFNINKKGNIVKILQGRNIGTIIKV